MQRVSWLLHWEKVKFCHVLCEWPLILMANKLQYKPTVLTQKCVFPAHRVELHVPEWILSNPLMPVPTLCIRILAYSYHFVCQNHECIKELGMMRPTHTGHSLLVAKNSPVAQKSIFPISHHHNSDEFGQDTLNCKQGWIWLFVLLRFDPWRFQFKKTHTVEEINASASYKNNINI